VLGRAVAREIREGGASKKLEAGPARQTLRVCSMRAHGEQGELI